jgi:hypothetical protein
VHDILGEAKPVGTRGQAIETSEKLFDPNITFKSEQDEEKWWSKTPYSLTFLSSLSNEIAMKLIMLANGDSLEGVFYHATQSTYSRAWIRRALNLCVPNNVQIHDPEVRYAAIFDAEGTPHDQDDTQVVQRLQIAAQWACQNLSAKWV